MDNNMQELNRMYRVSDMMLTSHSKLRDKYNCYNNFSNFLVITLSILTLLFMFAPNEIIEKSICYIKLSVWLSIISLIVLIITLLQMTYSWYSKEKEHDNAAKNYFNIKCKLHNVKANYDKVQYELVRSEYMQMCNYNIQIPEDTFLNLKRYHGQKIIISRYLSKYKSAYVWLVKLKLLFKDNFKCIKTKTIK